MSRILIFFFSFSFGIPAKARGLDFGLNCLRTLTEVVQKKAASMWVGRTTKSEHPRSAKARKYLEESHRIQSIFTAIDQSAIDPTKLTNMETVAERKSMEGTIPGYPGHAFHKLESAQYGKPKRKVFIKTFATRENLEGQPMGGWAMRDFDSVLHEIQWATFLSKMGWGPKFHGVMRTPEGRVALIFDYAEGTHLTPSSMSFPKLSPASHTRAIAQLKEMRDVMFDLRIQPDDFQFRMDENGKLNVIDSERFTVFDESQSSLDVLKADNMGIRLLSPDPRPLMDDLIKRISKYPN